MASTTLKLSDASERTSSFDLNINKEIGQSVTNQYAEPSWTVKVKSVN